jgi:hypothetical protein
VQSIISNNTCLFKSAVQLVVYTLIFFRLIAISRGGSLDVASGYRHGEKLSLELGVPMYAVEMVRNDAGPQGIYGQGMMQHTFTTIAS